MSRSPRLTWLTNKQLKMHVNSLIYDDVVISDDNHIINKYRIVKCPEVKVQINNIEVTALIDTGSQIDAVSEKWFENNRASLGRIETLNLANTTIKGAIGSKSKVIRRQVLLEVTIGDYKADVVFLIVPALSRDCIIGINLMSDAGCIIDLPNKQIQFTCDNEHKSPPQMKSAEIFSINAVPQQQQENIQEKIKSTVNNIEMLQYEQKQQLQEILIRNERVFHDKPGRISGYEHEIRVTDPTPFYQKGWPVPIAYQKMVEEEINKMLEYGVIERANSQYVNPLVTVIKKDKSVRLCLDARKINSVMIPDYEGAIPVNELLANCGGMKIMSTIDLRHSFWQVPLKKECRDFTGFQYKGKTYRFMVTPFGLKTSLASLTRGLDNVLSDEVKKFTLIYVDDCLCLSSSIEEHIHHLSLLFHNLLEANITVNFDKSQLFRKEISYLGYRLSTEGISTDPEKSTAIINFPTPKNQKQLKGFLGLTNFYNRFTSKYAATTQPLLDLLKKDRKFKWTAEHEKHFNTVKQLFLETVMLKHPDVNKQYYVQTDASNYAVGGQLYQYDEKGNIAVIAFTSRTLKKAELNYHTTEKELIGIIHCLQKFRMYLMGHRFTIITDNKALTFLQKCYLGNARIARWLMSIQEYDFDIIHCKGRENIVADVLSRNPTDSPDNKIESDYRELEINQIKLKMSKDTLKNIKRIGTLQSADSKLTNIINNLKLNNNKKLYDKYKHYNGILYREVKGIWKVYVPAQLMKDLIMELHQTYGHSGMQKTAQLFKEYFTGDQVNKILKDIIRTCDVCQRCKDYFKELKGETLPVIPTKKGELVSADYYGPLVTSAAGVRYILVIIDNFTKFVRLYGVKRATTRATLKKVGMYCQELGKPDAILTDNGTQFTAALWRDGLSKLGIRAKYTAIRNPCTNLAERTNRQMGNLFRIFVREQHTKWAKYLKTVECCINETYHDTIDTTPYEAQFARKPIRDWTRFLDMTVLKEAEIVDAQKIHLKIKQKRERHAHKVNTKNKIVQLQLGDKVLIKAYRGSDALNKIVAKFCEMFEGPYVITAKLSPSTYELSHEDLSKGIRGNFNIRQLKRYHKQGHE